MTNRNSNYYFSESPQTLRWLAAVCTQAADNDRSVRLLVREDNSLQVKAGGAWSAPLESEFDLSRDSATVDPMPTENTGQCSRCQQGAHGAVNRGACVCCGQYLGRHRDWDMSASTTAGEWS